MIATYKSIGSPSCGSASDRTATESLVVRASAIVRTEADGPNGDDHKRVLPARGDLAPWQVRWVTALTISAPRNRHD